ncbi:hypothetical protein KOI35_28225 [Actinoplanes bogorensis]|uniref:Galactose oxidase n=1 Tax=Paractinoplanes bogorensis TaxID=1610840 RepID=A0ABS5YVD1_9ACTN|nr:kelch motif-containing protein [Actinoplanes bogorensis]MBU2667405.1 hypothetical protein [Actinoplanes bogorensis]
MRTLMIAALLVVPAPATWVDRPPLHDARIGGVAATVDGILVEAGGFGLDGLVASTEVRSSSGNWRVVAPMPTARANAAAATLGGEVWVTGGYGEADPPVDVVERYNPRTNKWSNGPALPVGRAQAGAATLRGVLYVVGGDIATADGEAVTATAIAYDPRRHRWSSIAPLSAARDRLRLVAAGDYLYAIGGETTAVERYDPRRDRWTTVAAMNQSRAVPGATLISRGRIAVVGGCEFVAGELKQFRRTTEVFDPATNRWRLLPALLPVGRCSLAAATESDGTLLAIAGGVTGGTPTNAVTALNGI